MSPRVVLPITGSGLVVTDRWCWGFLLATMAVSAGLILYLTRGTTFNSDELNWVYTSPHLDLEQALEPYNGNLLVLTRLIYKAVLEAFGPGYLPFRVLGAAAVLLAAGVFYVVAKRRIGAVPALAPTIILLFFGSSGYYAFAPIGFAALASIAAGLGALLALERDDGLGDAAACGLTVLSVAMFSTGLAFLVGVAISVLMRRDRLRRAWIFLVPLALYAGWYLWSSTSTSSASELTKPSNVLLFPNYVGDALAAALAGLAGLNYDFSEPFSNTNEIGWGRPLAVVALVALVVRIRRGDVPRSLWVSLGIALAAWGLGTIAFIPNLREPTSTRYVYVGAIAVLLIATAAARSVRFSTARRVVLFGACALSLGANISLLRVYAAEFRNYSTAARAEFAAFELARSAKDVDLDPGPRIPRRYQPVAPPAGEYFDVLARYGSLALPVSELERQPEDVRRDADQLLVNLLGVHVESRGPPPRRGECAVVRRGGADEPIRFELPPGGASIRARSTPPAALTVGRFSAVPSIELGDLPPGRTVALEIPRDPSRIPWRASVAGASRVEVCPLR